MFSREFMKPVKFTPQSVEFRSEITGAYGCFFVLVLLLVFPKFFRWDEGWYFYYFVFCVFFVGGAVIWLAFVRRYVKFDFIESRVFFESRSLISNSFFSENLSGEISIFRYDFSEGGGFDALLFDLSGNEFVVCPPLNIDVNDYALNLVDMSGGRLVFFPRKKSPSVG